MIMLVNKPAGNTLLFVLILLLITGLLSMSLFENSLQENNNSIQFQRAANDFYTTEACLLKIKYRIAQIKTPLLLQPNCKNQFCSNPYLANLDLPAKPDSWWLAHGISCGINIWQYTELIYNRANQQYIYRISSYHQHHILLQLYIDRHFPTTKNIDYSWRQIY